MTKLKTLKDLQKDYEWRYDTHNALKKAAIEWVKKLEKYGKKENSSFCLEHKRNYSECVRKQSTPTCTYVSFHPYENDSLFGAIDMLKQFFNLAEEDLK